MAPGHRNRYLSAEGNEAGKIDLIHDKYRGETVKYSIANDVIIHGPFELEQGGHVLSIHNPVFTG